ncbi:MAG: ABC transporter ATP-binding protein [Deltaproteobacteria bacterium]|nr:ABC transporter ATP-binding protein [Deltaproteobacteria bacterium]
MGKDSVIIQLENITFSYAGGKPILNDLCFTLEEGVKLGIIGQNGSGKTTLLHIIMGLLRPSSGTIRAFGKPVETKKDFLDVRRKIGFLFQDADDQLFCPTVLEDIAFGPLNLGKSPTEAREMAMETLGRLNLKGFEERVTHNLSGGEKKLVALATVLVMEPKALILDEPTTGLDEDTNIRIITLLNQLDIGTIIVSHEYDFLARTTRDVYGMQNGQVIHNGDSSALHSHYHKHLAGKLKHRHATLISQP